MAPVSLAVSSISGQPANGDFPSKHGSLMATCGPGSVCATSSASSQARSMAGVFLFSSASVLVSGRHWYHLDIQGRQNARFLDSHQSLSPTDPYPTSDPSGKYKRKKALIFAETSLFTELDSFKWRSTHITHMLTHKPFPPMFPNTANWLLNAQRLMGASPTLPQYY